MLQRAKLWLAAAHVLMQDAADQGLIGDASLQRPCADRLEVAAGEANIDALILLSRGSCGFT